MVPAWSKTMARELVVPWSKARMYFIGGWGLSRWMRGVEEGDETAWARASKSSAAEVAPGSCVPALRSPR